MAKITVAKPRKLRSHHLSSLIIFIFILVWFIATLLICDFTGIHRKPSFLFYYWAASFVILFLLLLSFLCAWNHFAHHGHTFGSDAKNVQHQEGMLKSTCKLEPHDVREQNAMFIANVASDNRLVSEGFLYQ